MSCEKDHLCNCGTATHTPHRTGESGCTRRMAEVKPIWNVEMVGTHQEWTIGNSSVSDYTLKWQRGYREYTCGCWARAKESTNSLPDDFG